MSIQDSPCLRFPENLPPQLNFTQEAAVNMLMRAAGLATQTPFVWSWLDKPGDGSLFLLFVQQRFPNDGLRYQDQDTLYKRPIGANGELEIIETKHGFIPGAGETSASRVRRRFRLSRGGHPGLVLVHYSRGQASQIPPHLANQPVRQYPLRQLNEPAVFVLGDKVGQKVPAAGGMPMVSGGGGGAFPGRGDPQAMLAQQNRDMEALERRAQRDRSASMNQRMPPQQQPQRPMDDEDSADELDQISTRTLALTRYRRNHELMNEVFMHAAFGDKTLPQTPPAYSIFSKDDLEAQISKLTSEIQDLRAKSAAREAAHIEASSLSTTSMSMNVDSAEQSLPSVPMVVVEGAEA